MTSATLRLEPLDLAQTLGCGQTFRWTPQRDGSWKGPLDDQLVTLRKIGPELKITSVPGSRQIRSLVSGHLRAKDDVSAIQQELALRDSVLAKGMQELRGLRIVKVDEWECLISFMLATYANIPRISGMINGLAAVYGRMIGEGTHAFPTLQQLRMASESELCRLGLGYRAKYIHSVCRRLSADELDRMKELPYEGLIAELKELPGVGDKVADCVALFGFGKLEAFPIDVWMERALWRLYRQKGSYRKLAAFAHKRFGEYAGYAQEYLYYNERAHAPNGSCVFSKD